MVFNGHYSLLMLLTRKYGIATVVWQMRIIIKNYYDIREIRKFDNFEKDE